MEKLFFCLLIFVPLAFIAGFVGASAPVIFILCAIAIIPLAKYIGESTGEIASRTSPAIGGLLNASFGNAPELLIGFFALRAGLFDLVKASITGSIISNLLLGLGVAMFVGGWKREKQTFNKTAVLASSSTLFLVAIALVVPALFVQTQSALPPSLIQHLSVVVSCVLLLVYIASLFFTLRTHKHLYTEEVETFEPAWSMARSLITLAFATIAVAWISELLVGSVTPLVSAWGWSQLFLGVVVLAIIGNAAEQFSAVMVARKNRMDLSLQISIGSATQIAMVVAPVLVLASVALGTPMDLVFSIFELIVIVLSVLIVNIVVADGESNWLEGVQLLAAYFIIAVAFFFHP